MSYRQVIAVNSFWSLSNYVVTGVAGLTMSILLTRYLGPFNYGIYSYLISIVAVSGIVLDLGIGGTLNKYLPRYYEDEKNRKIAVDIFWKSLLIKVLVYLLVACICFATRGSWQEFIYSKSGMGVSVVYFLIIGCLPLLVSQHLSSFLVSIQRIKKVALSNIISLSISVISILLVIRSNLGLEYIIYIQLMANIVLSISMFTYSVPLLAYSQEPNKKLLIKDIGGFSLLNYINVLVQFVVWSYSEIFFLSKFSPSREIGYYSLAFSLSSILIALPGLFLRVLYNTQYELLEQKQEDKSDYLTYIGIKYTMLVFLPLGILASVFINDIVVVVYGSPYAQVGKIFPLIIFGSLLSASLSAVTVKAINKNKIYGIILLLGVIGAILNIVLDVYLIPRYHSMGAAMANFSSQMVSISLVFWYVVSVVPFKIEWSHISKLLLMNFGLWIFLYGISLLGHTYINVIALFIGLYIYAIGLKATGVTGPDDRKIISELRTISPRLVSMLIGFIAKPITE